MPMPRRQITPITYVYFITLSPLFAYTYFAFMPLRHYDACRRAKREARVPACAAVRRRYVILIRRHATLYHYVDMMPLLRLYAITY